MQCPFAPIRIDNGVAVYSLVDVLLYGEPCSWGEVGYEVVDNEQSYRLEWQDEINLARDGRTIHRYDRVQRFKCIVNQFIGHSRVMLPAFYFDIHGDHTSPTEIWGTVRKMLKEEGLHKFYNRIPCLLERANYPFKIRWTQYQIDQVNRDFCKIHEYYKEINTTGYFPNLRFCALKLMERHGVVFEYFIPCIIVKKIQTRLELFWDRLCTCL